MTRAVLIGEVLKKLSIYGSGQSVNADDHDDVEALIDPMIEELRESDIVIINDTQSFDNKLIMPLILYFAAGVASKFGATTIDNMSIDDAKKSAEMRLSKVSNTPYTGSVQEAVYY
jgi:hypothetical protein